MTKKPGGEFFEAFRRPPETGADGSLPGSFHSSRSRGNGSGRPGTIVLRLETATIVALIGVVLIVVAFVVGRRSGRSAARIEDDAPAGNSATRDDARVPASNGSTASAPAPAANEPFWTLRVQSMLPPEHAIQLRNDLRAMGHDAFVYDAGGRASYTVNVGRFSSERSAEAERLKDEFKTKKHRGTPLFKSCYFTKISNHGRIVQ